MKLTFFSNFMNHHQLPFCLEMVKVLGDDFKFVATKQIPDERIKLGYEDMNSKYDFVVSAYKDVELAKKLAIESDIVIFGEAPNFYLRLRKDKITFRYSERIFKSRFSIRSLIGMILRNYNLNKDYNYLLCASAYAAKDYNMFNFFKNRTYKWGYFPEVKKYDNIEKLINNKNDNSILWVGRFIEWKHPEIMIDVAKFIKANNLKYKITMIGEGVLKNDIKKCILDNNLENFIEVYDSMSPQNVRKYMEKSKIFLFTSDRHEGWGAVLNESMNSGCIVIANNTIGSVPYVISNGKNGFKYKSIDELYSILLNISSNNIDCYTISKNAYETISKIWCPEEAAKRFLQMAKNILENKEIDNLFVTGPLSPDFEKRS